MMVLLKLGSLCLLPLSAQEIPVDHHISGNDPIEIEADTSIICNEKQGQCVATGNAVAIRGKFKVNADKLTLHFQTVGKKHEMTHLTAHGHVVMSSPTQRAYGDNAHYDAGLDRLKLTGKNLKLEDEKGHLVARDSIEYWNKKQQGYAYGDAVAVFPKKQQLMKADTLVAHFRNAPGQESRQELDHIDALGNVFVSSPEEIITADNATYFADAELAELKDNVTITKGENQIHGGYATFNMKTNVAQLYGGKPGSKKTKRIHGLIIPKDAKTAHSTSLMKKSDK